jgi:parallel beta-helix repeat protein
LRAIAGFSLVLLLLFAWTAAFGAVLDAESSGVVRVPEDYPSIQAAIDAAAAGDTIIVSEGIYAEGNIHVYKTLVLQANGTVVVDGLQLGHVFIFDSSHVAIRGFTIQNSSRSEGGCGILLGAGSRSNLIEGNVITNNRRAIGTEGANFANVISNNTILNNQYGISLGRSANNMIVGNEIVNNTELGIVLVYQCDGNSIIDNFVAGSYYGILCTYFIFSGTISGNTIVENAHGIYLDTTASNIEIFHNSFVNNTCQACSASWSSVWDDGYPSGGNYWSDYDGLDLFSGSYQNETGSDGIGDTPRNIDADDRDNYPLMKPYGGTFDVGICDLCLSQMVVPEGLCLDVSMKIINYGLNTETVNLTIRVNGTAVHAQTIELASRNSSSAAYVWNTTGYARGNYSLTVAVDVPVDDDTSDNFFVFGIRISKLGDLNGDDYVGIDDLFAAAVSFGSELGHPRWNPEADLNQDRYVGIDDIFVIASRFGQDG